MFRIIQRIDIIMYRLDNGLHNTKRRGNNNQISLRCQLGQCTAASCSLVPASALAPDSSMARPGEDLLARMELNPELAPGGSGVPAIIKMMIQN